MLTFPLAETDFFLLGAMFIYGEEKKFINAYSQQPRGILDMTIFSSLVVYSLGTSAGSVAKLCAGIRGCNTSHDLKTCALKISIRASRIDPGSSSIVGTLERKGH